MRLSGFVLLALVFSVAVPDHSSAAKRKRRPARGAIEVKSVDDAWVFMDGRRVGKTPLKAFLASPGVHQIAVQKPGHTEVKKTVQVKAGAVAKVRAVPVLIAKKPAQNPGLTAPPKENAPPKTDKATGPVLPALAPVPETAPAPVVLFPEMPGTLGSSSESGLETRASNGSRPWYRRWYTLTAVGVVLATGIITAIMLANGGDSCRRDVDGAFAPGEGFSTNVCVR